MLKEKTKKTAKKKQYKCKICNLIVSAENVCGCRKDCEIICCGEKMVSVK